MAVSARNQLTGIISAVATGAVNDEVELTLPGGAKLVAIVTHSSKEALGLVNGKEAIALIKAPWVTLATEDCGLKFSARNQFAGVITGLKKGDVIVGANQQPVKNIADLRKIFDAKPPVLALNIQRGDASIYLLLQ